MADRFSHPSGRRRGYYRGGGRGGRGGGQVNSNYEFDLYQHYVPEEGERLLGEGRPGGSHDFSSAAINGMESSYRPHSSSYGRRGRGSKVVRSDGNFHARQSFYPGAREEQELPPVMINAMGGGRRLDSGGTQQYARQYQQQQQHHHQQYADGFSGSRRSRRRSPPKGRSHQWDPETRMARRDDFTRGPPGPAPFGERNNVNLCFPWALHSNCTRVLSCRFQHDLQIVAADRKAHARGIYALCSATTASTDQHQMVLGIPVGSTIVELYTASQDRTVKRWTLTPTGTSDAGAAPSGAAPAGADPEVFRPAVGGLISKAMSSSRHPEQLNLNLDSVLTLEAPCLSVYFAKQLLFCGLSNGVIKVFERDSDRSIELKSHTSEIHCVQLIDDVLVSGDWSGCLKLWKPDPAERSFAVSAAVELGSPITCFAEIPTASNLAQRHLWVGCVGAIKVLDLMTLAIVNSIDVAATATTATIAASSMSQSSETPFSPSAQPPPVVLSLMFVEGCVICCILGRGIRIFNANTGEALENITSSSGAASNRDYTAMTGCMSDEGPVLLCGMTTGRFNVLRLPDLTERVVVKHHHDKDVRAIHNLGGSPSYFATGGFDGSLAIWFWRKPSELLGRKMKSPDTAVEI